MSSMIPVHLTQWDKVSYLNPELATELARGTLSLSLPLERWHYRQAATATLHLCGACDLNSVPPSSSHSWWFIH